MTTIKLDSELVFELDKSSFFEGYKLITDELCDTWRWGHVRQYVVQDINSNYYFALLDFHSEEGYQGEDVIEFTSCQPVSRVVTEWVKK